MAQLIIEGLPKSLEFNLKEEVQDKSIKRAIDIYGNLIKSQEGWQSFGTYYTFFKSNWENMSLYPHSICFYEK